MMTTEITAAIEEARDLLNQTTIDSVEIRQLRREAGEAGDSEMVLCCDLAIEINVRLAVAEADDADVDVDVDMNAGQAAAMDDSSDRLQASIDAWRVCATAIAAARAMDDGE